MSDPENITTPPPPEQDSATEAHQEEHRPEPTDVNNAEKPNHMSFSIWPPAQRTRDAVVNRLIETLSTPSVLSNRYGTMPQAEASAAARLIEEEAFATAGGSDAADDDGIQILQVYSKEISKRMLDAVKTRNSSASAVADVVSQPETTNISSTASEDVTHPDTESSWFLVLLLISIFLASFSFIWCYIRVSVMFRASVRRSIITAYGFQMVA